MFILERNRRFTNNSGRLGVSAVIPHDEDNPAEWWFGPSFLTNKIVFTARGINLMNHPPLSFLELQCGCGNDGMVRLVYYIRLLVLA